MTPSGSFSSAALCALAWTCLFVPGIRAQAVAVSISPNVSLPQTWNAVSQILPPSFCGMGIEPSNLFSFSGGTSTNQLSVNLLRTLANHTGVPPHLRIGGNAQDYMIYNASFSGCYIQGNQNAQGQGAVAWDSQIVGPCYFTSLNRFPQGTPITFGLNFAYNAPDWPQRITAMAEAARSQLSNVELVSFEIGNEPDIYLSNQFRTGDWSGPTYVQQWLQRADSVYEQVLRPNNLTANFFEPTCSANTIGNTFQISLLAQNTNITQPAPNQPQGQNNSYITTWNQHDYYYYIGVSQTTLSLDVLMDLSTTYAQFSHWQQEVRSAFATGHGYALREMGSVGPNGLDGVSNVFGATLWTLNFFLYAATLNISSVEFHMTVNSYAAPWQPTRMRGSPAHVRTTYYAFAAMTNIIGGGCRTRVAPMTIPQYPQGYDRGRLTGYSSFVGNNLASLIFINSKIANASTPNKPSVNINIRSPALAGRTFFLSYLTADGADSSQNTTWNGISYEQDATGLATPLNQSVQTVQVAQDGTASFSVRDSEAVVANLDAQIGSGPNAMYNETACRELISSGAVPSELPTQLPTPTPSPSPSTNPGSFPGPDVFNPGGSPSTTTRSSSGLAHAATAPPAKRVLEVAALVGGVAAVLA